MNTMRSLLLALLPVHVTAQQLKPVIRTITAVDSIQTDKSTSESRGGGTIAVVRLPI